VLILRDVLGFHADEVAGMLGTTVDAVTRALKRARASLERRLPRPSAGHKPPPADVDALVAPLTEDVFIAMPPIPFEYEGREVVARFCVGLFDAGRRFDLVPTRANGQPAFGA
jgi:RNA polymerase sigma-70 factor (ECF subfamily)